METQLYSPSAVGLPFILQLPQEILEEILSSLDLHTDLLSLALTCHALASQVIPRHTDYRILRVRTLNPTIFAHLARRADLTRNIREVHISERNNYTTADRIPKALVDPNLDCDPVTNGTYDEELKVCNVVKSLRYMWDLKVFTWSWNLAVPAPKGGVVGANAEQQNALAALRLRPTSEARFEEAILGEVVRKPSLKHFGISGAFGAHVSGLPLERSLTYPLWNLSNLKSLCLLGDAWLKPSNALPLCIMLSRSANLEYLEIPLEFKQLHSIHLPRLKKVKLHLQSGATTSVDNSSARFLENNPTIEELSWYPIGVPVLKPGSLPNLKHLKTNLQVIRGMAREAESLPASASSAMLVPPPIPRSRKRLSKIEEEAEPEEGFEMQDEEASSSISTSLPMNDGTFYSPPASPIEPMSVPPPTPTAVLYPSASPYLRQIESLDVTGLSASELLSLPFMNRRALKRLALHQFTDVETVLTVAEVFPNIEWLMLPVRHSPSSSPSSTSSSSSSPATASSSTNPTTASSSSQPLTIDTLLSVLPHFQSLETFRGQALWSAIGGGGRIGEREKTKMHEVLGELVQLCPNLREVDHCDFYEKRWGFKRVVIERTRMVVGNEMDVDVTGYGKQPEMEEVEAIGYAMKKPFMRDCFDVLDGAFN